MLENIRWANAKSNIGPMFYQCSMVRWDIVSVWKKTIKHCWILQFLLENSKKRTFSYKVALKIFSWPGQSGGHRTVALPLNTPLGIDQRNVFTLSVKVAVTGDCFVEVSNNTRCLATRSRDCFSHVGTSCYSWRANRYSLYRQDMLRPISVDKRQDIENIRIMTFNWFVAATTNVRIIFVDLRTLLWDQLSSIHSCFAGWWYCRLLRWRLEPNDSTRIFAVSWFSLWFVSWMIC